MTTKKKKQTQKASQEPEVKNAKAPEQEETLKQEASQGPEKPEEPEVILNPVDAAKYDKFTGIKFLQLGGAKLKDEQLKELADLETELKSCSGAVPVRTVRAAIRNEICLMVEGVPVTEAIEKIVVDADSTLYYFGK
jgi:hypothetical protein